MADNNTFTKVDISQFYDEPDYVAQQNKEGITVLTTNEKILYDELMTYIKEKDPERFETLEDRMKDLRELAASIENFPSLLERHKTLTEVRTPQLLINSLIKHQIAEDSTLQLPSKAVLGKAYIVSKIHTFSSLSRISEQLEAPASLTQALKLETTTIMFTLMAEDVYINLISDKNQPEEFRRQWALALILLWEHWNDQTIESVAPVLQSVWLARRKLAPAFGTMMGTSELLQISIQMDDQWIQFIREKMGDKEVSLAMEEFLFGISYEQIKKLREILKSKGIPAIDRNEVSSFLGEHIKANAGMGYRDFYTLYTVRRDNARARSRMNLEGPHQTIEDYFIKFTTEQNKLKQTSDAFAKS